MKDIKIIIATHKQYYMPKDSIYLPIHVGKLDKQDLGYIGDDTGENISDKNPFYCELTGLYWAWKNLDAKYIGLIHYRRFFSNADFFTRMRKKYNELYASEQEINELLENYQIIVPKKRNYYIETLYSHYGNTFYSEHLDITKDIILEKYPEYLVSFEATMLQRSGHMFNMFIMSKELVNDYCIWLFDILFELEKRIPINSYNSFHARFYGRVSELLFNVWLNKTSKEKKLKIKELPFVYGEKINWFRKGAAFLMAKFFGKKYDRSF